MKTTEYLNAALKAVGSIPLQVVDTGVAGPSRFIVPHYGDRLASENNAAAWSADGRMWELSHAVFGPFEGK